MEGSNPYTSQMRTFAAIEKLATDEGNLATVAASDILKCFNIAFLTEKYGDVPFSEAVHGRDGDLFPKFDSQKEIYEWMFTALDNLYPEGKENLLTECWIEITDTGKK